MKKGVIKQIEQIIPTATSVLNELYEKGILSATCNETGSSTAQNLLQILTQPRAAGLDPIDIFWIALERLFKPETTTQKINIPFKNGKVKATTCVSAARIYVLTANSPGEYTRIVQELTRPELSFVITRWSADPRMIQAKIKWIQDCFPYKVIDNQTISVTIFPDSNALNRAILEQNNRFYSEYNFGQFDRKNSRSAIDVLLQSAFTNYALRNEYDSNTDTNRTDQTEGIPFGSFGYLLLDEILSRDVIYVRGPATTDWPGSNSIIASPLEAPDAPDVS
jgi:hypothetical protein